MTALLFGLLVVASPAQDTLRLSVLQRAAVMSDPRTRQLALREEATELRLRNLAVERLPQFALTGEAMLQSDVIVIPVNLQAVQVPLPPRDRYEVAVSADWLLVDGGARKARSAVERAQLVAALADVAAALEPLRMQVLDAYFDALVLQERSRELETLIEDLEARLTELRGRVRAGAALHGDTAAVRAEVFVALQQRLELDAQRATALDILARLTGNEIAADDVLAVPVLSDELLRVRSDAQSVAPRSHPQFASFAARRDVLARRESVVNAQKRPQVSAFGEFAFGRPGLQQFEHSIHDYWITGVRARWAPWSWGATAREVDALRIDRQIIDSEEAAFAQQLARQARPSLHAIERLQTTIALDEQIITLRDQVERQMRVQLTERAITAAAYIDARSDLQEARIALVRHRMELARAQAQYLTLLGVVLP
jgi:outer membrane protein TolC